ncbi:hypothetical protein C0989_008275 [Termitomyces sp. Mn162]|nr:hypothetical protein C0989_008275 [Termitomyces sp. Mn162]
MHQDSHDKEFFVNQQQAAQAAVGAPAVSNSGSNDDDDVPISKQCILDSNSNNDTVEHHRKEQHNANARQLLAINAEKFKLDLKHLNDTMPSHLSDSWETTLAPHGMLMNPEQICLILKLIWDGRSKVTMGEWIHAALLLQELHWISFYTTSDLHDCTTQQVMELT